MPASIVPVASVGTGRLFAGIRRATAPTVAIGAAGGVFVGRWLWLPFFLGGCTSQFALGPAAWSTVPPVIPGFTPVPLPGGGFVEEPTSALTGAGAATTPPPPTEIETLVTGLDQAQKVRTLVRQLAR